MSRATIRAIEDAIEAHNADEGEGIITNWVTVVEIRRHHEDPSVSSWTTDYITADASPHAHHGLARWLLSTMEELMLGDGNEDSDDDDD